VAWTAHFHGGPADGQDFEIDSEPAALLSMEQDLYLGAGLLHTAAYLYRRTAHDPRKRVCIYHLSDIQVADHRAGTTARN
jgi:hypothetical protein